MKIKLALLEEDQGYLNRIVAAFGTRYADKFEIYSFTDMSIALSALEPNRIDVLVASDSFQVDVNAIPKRCGFAYFVDSADIDTVRQQRAICKYQKADLIYKQILSIYSENAGSISGLKLDDEHTKVIAFSSPSGGTGTSSVACACAVHFAGLGKKVLYLNMERFGSVDPFFEAEGLFDMSDIIFALKNKKANLAMKLESCVKQDRSGVYFYSQPKVALDMLELSADEVRRLISGLKLTGTYDYIVVDADFSFSKESLMIYRQAHGFAWVGDGTEVSNIKIQRAYEALLIVEKNEDACLTDRICLIYNKFSNKTGKTVEDAEIKNAGGAPVYMHASTKQVIEQLAQMNMFENIVG